MMKICRFRNPRNDRFKGLLPSRFNQKKPWHILLYKDKTMFFHPGILLYYQNNVCKKQCKSNQKGYKNNIQNDP